MILELEAMPLSSSAMNININIRSCLRLAAPALSFAFRSPSPTSTAAPSSLRHSILQLSAGTLPTFSASPSVVCRASSSQSSSTMGVERERLIQHLLVKEDQLSLLLELQRQAQQGRDLSDLAAEHSICPSKSDGGMLGWVQKGQMVPEFEEAAFSAPLNKIVRVKTKFGWHLVQALSEREAGFLKEIQPEELFSNLQDENFVKESQLIDVREPSEISLAAINGFKVYPLSQFNEWGPRIASELDPAKDTYVLCHHGVRSLQAAQWLKTQGFQRLYNVAGGIHQYSVKADNRIPTY